MEQKLKNKGDQICRTPNQAELSIQGFLSKIQLSFTNVFIEKSPIKKGMRGLDLYTSAEESTLLLKALVGKKGKVTSIDASSWYKYNLKQKPKRHQVRLLGKQLEYLPDKEKTSSFDFVYSGFFLNQVSNPLDFLQYVYDQLEPNGFAMVEELDYSKFQCFPDSIAFDHFLSLFLELKKRLGHDAKIGKKLHALFKQAKFNNCQTQLVRPTFLTRTSEKKSSHILKHISPLLLHEKLISLNELQTLQLQLKEFEQQPNTMITLPGTYQVLGFKSCVII